MLKQIPNIITSLNLLCGCVAVLFVVTGDMVAASFFVFLGIIFDFFDGFAARLLKAQSDIGLEFDSLADLVTSGVVPGLVMVQLLNMSIFGNNISLSNIFSTTNWNTSFMNYLPFIGLMIVIASAYRLAKFNVDTRQTENFIGLPTPANTLFILSLPLILHFQHSQIAESIILNKWFLIGITIISSLLLNAEIRLFALKFKTWDFKINSMRYVFLGLCLIALILLKFVAIPFIILLYILLSLLFAKKL